MGNKFRVVGMGFCLGLCLALLVGCGGSSSGGGSGTTTTTGTSTGSNATAVASINQLKTPQVQQAVDPEPFPFMIRAKADLLPEFNQLVALGPAAVEDILNEFRRTPTFNDEDLLSLLAYALEKMGDKRAIPVLADWLDANMFAGLPGWSTDFVTHTIKVLQPQAGLNTQTFTYLIDEKLDTLLQARQSGGTVTQSILPANAIFQGVLSGTFTPEQKRACEKKILVTGINKNGQEETLDLTYKVVSRDVNDIVVDPEESQAQRDAAAARAKGWAETDEKIYGGSSYLPGTGSKITDASNCGGRVAEKILNQVSARLGQPLVLGPGGSTAGGIRRIAETFGAEVPIKDIDLFTVIAIGVGDSVAHVEVPISFNGTNAAILSKWDQGKDRFHGIDTSSSLPDVTQFAASVGQVNGNPFFFGKAGVRFFKLDPTRIKSIVLDSSQCPCTPGDPAGIPVQFSQPTKEEVPDRVITVSGSVGTGQGGTPIVSGATLSVNGVPQNVAVVDGSFQAEVVLRSGDNEIRVGVEGVDGRRGCAVKKIKSTTPKTTLSATLTWNLGGTDVDLYVTQPDKQTAWYNRKTTSAGGRLDVDNTSGFGPENYFISLAADSPLRTGPYTIRVHYFRDHQKTDNTPTRPVRWKVVILTNEGTPNEKYLVRNGTLSVHNPGNDSPESDGADWATAETVTLTASP